MDAARGTRATGQALSTRYARVLALLIALFMLRVAGQALQRWAPQSFLPPFDEFQGSSLSYGVLPSSQVVIVGAMVWATWTVAAGTRAMHKLRRRCLLKVGAVYMAGSIARIVVGLTMPSAPAWFSAWIPAAFHVVLAAFVLALARYHALRSRILTTEVEP